MRTRAAEAAAKRLRPVFAAASLLLILLLAVFAYALAHSQSQQRHDVERRFNDRARVAATVNESLIALSTDSLKASDAQRFGSQTVDQKLLTQRTTVQQQLYAAVVSADGKVLAKTGTAPAGIASDPQVKEALGSKEIVYSSLMRGPGGAITIESAIAFPTKYGLRVDVTGSKANVLSQFLNSFLSRLPSVTAAKSYVLDHNAKVIATPGAAATAGTPLADTALAKAVATGSQGSYDGNRYFTSAPIHGTPWRIVLSAAKSDLYRSVKSTVSWLIFAAFALVSLVGMLLLWRVLISNAELEWADLSRTHALEINDNVVQRLVLAKYALDRGATETSQQKLAETLRETQQLVTSMLEEREITPGSLRRAAPAETDGRPEPSALPQEDGR